MDDATLRFQAAKQVERVRSFKVHLVAFVVGMTVITGVWAVTEYQNSGDWPHRLSQGSGTPGEWNVWILWPLLFWGQILCVHALVTYLRRPTTEADVEREFERMTRSTNGQAGEAPHGRLCPELAGTARLVRGKGRDEAGLGSTTPTERKRR
jgi:hypothetical protein